MYDKNNPSSIRSLFDAIAPRYDFGNSLLSFHLHALWNNRLVKGLIDTARPGAMLDLCAGTGDIALRAYTYAKNQKIQIPNFHLVDFSSKMLDVAKKRTKVAPNFFHFYEADVQALPLPANHFDATSIAYGIRNVKNMQRCFEEVYRVLKPGGWLAIVELTRPQKPLLASMHSLYLHTAVPLVGRFICSNKDAYCYLQKSIQNFVAPKDLVRSLTQVGFSSIQTIPQLGGIATLFFAQKGV